MAKTRKLKPAVDDVPAVDTPNVDLPVADPGEVKGPAQQRTASGRFLEDNIFQAFATYLQTKPYGEVAGLIQSLSSLPVMKDVIITYNS